MKLAVAIVLKEHKLGLLKATWWIILLFIWDFVFGIYDFTLGNNWTGILMMCLAMLMVGCYILHYKLYQRRNPKPIAQPPAF